VAIGHFQAAQENLPMGGIIEPLGMYREPQEYDARLAQLRRMPQIPDVVRAVCLAEVQKVEAAAFWVEMEAARKAKGKDWGRRVPLLP